MSICCHVSGPICVACTSLTRRRLLCSKYYEKDSLVADPDYGSILSSLLGKGLGRPSVFLECRR